MANTLQLKNDIKKLKLGLKSKGLSASIKDKLKTQLTKVENELKSSKAGAPARKVSTTKSTKDALDSLKKLIKKKGYGVYKNAGVDLKKDAQEGALATGRRTSQGLKGNQFKSKSESKGNTYYEYRANRLDVKQPKGKQKYPKLEEGGYMAKGGKLKKSYMMGDEEVYIKDSSIGLDDEVCLYYKKDDTILKCISKNSFDSFVKQGKLVPKMADGGISQGYDDKEDERLAMKYGKMASKDLDSTHARRDDARFEERMANGGKLIGKQKNLDVNKNGKLDTEDFKMLRKQRMAEGGITEKEVVDSNAQMVLSQIKAVKHHADELSQVVSKNSDIEAWVVAKIERASTDLSDITHYLDGQHEKMSMGGSVYHHAHKMDKK